MDTSSKLELCSGHPAYFRRAAIFVSVFFIKICFVSVRPKQDVRHPVRGSAHLFADCLQAGCIAAFDYQLIMDVSYDEAMPEGLYGIAEDVAADGLDDIFNEFRSVGFDAFPFLCRADAFVGDGFSAKLIDTDSGLHI